MEAEGHFACRYFPQATLIVILLLLVMTFNLTVFCYIFYRFRLERRREARRASQAASQAAHTYAQPQDVQEGRVTLKPGRPRAIGVTFDSIELEWTKPEQGVHNVTSYTIHYRSTADPPYQWTKKNHCASAIMVATDGCTRTHERVLVTQLVEKTTYYFKVQPEYIAGIGLESDISEPIKTKGIIPSQPGKPRCSSISNDSIHLEWTKPEQGAHNIIAYCVFYHSHNNPPDKWSKQKVKSDEEMMTISQLLEKTVYSFKVQSECEDGLGLESEISEPIATKIIIPSKPGKPIPLIVTHNSIQLKWTKPQQGAHNITSYTVFYCSTNDPAPDQWSKQKTNKEEVIVVNLSERTTYKFKVQPECEDGFGVDSDISEPIRTEMIIPSKPGKPVASNVTHDSIQLEWTKPEQGAHNITSYTVFYCSTSDPSREWKEQKTITAEGKVTILQLLEKNAYFFKIRPECVGYNVFLSESDTSEAIMTKAIVPSKPGQPEASNRTHNSIQLKWTKPEQGAHNITSYTIFYRSTSDPHDQWMQQKTSTAEERATVSQLSEKNTYIFKVRPESRCGEYSLESSESDPIKTTMIIPSKPGKPKASNITHDSVQLEWTIPEQGAHNITSYTTFYRSNRDPPDQWKEMKVETVSNRMTVSKLSEKTIYFFKVRPMSEGGYGIESDVSGHVKTTESLTFNKVFGKLWEAREKWYNIGVKLGIKTTDLDAIQHDHGNKLEPCLREMIKLWLKQTEVTWEILIDALRDETVGFNDLANSIASDSFSEAEYQCITDQNTSGDEVSGEGFTCPQCGNCSIDQYLRRECPKFNSLSDLAFPYLCTKDLTENEKVTVHAHLLKQTQNIITEFSKLLRHIRWSLRQQNIDPEELALSVIDIAPRQSLTRPLLDSTDVKKKVDSVNEIVGDLQRNNYISFINYHILRHFVDLYGTEEDKTMFRNYEAKFLIFCKRSVFQIPKAVFGPPPRNGEVLAFKVTKELTENLPHKQSSERDDLSPNLPSVKESSKALDLSLEDTLTIQSDIAEVLGLKDVGRLVFLGVQRGCIELRFSAPKSAMDTVKTQLNTAKCGGFANLEDKGIHILCGPPGKPYSTNVSYDSVNLEWNRPEYQGLHPLQHYVIHYRSDIDPKQNWKTLTIRKENAEISNLPHTNVAFIFKVQAINKFGSGVESEESDPIYLLRMDTQKQVLVPSQPGKPTFSNITHDSVELQWTEPEHGGVNIFSYTVFYRSINDPPDQWIKQRTKSTEKSVLISQLSEKNTYYFKVQAECESGLIGLESDISEPIKTKMIIPSKPGKPKASEINHNSIELEWTEPEQGAHNITSFTILYRSTTDPPDQWTMQIAEAAVYKISVTQLSEKTVYYFKVKPEYENGFGPESSESEPIQTRMIIPSEPGKPKALNITHDSIQLEWTKPEQGFHNVTSYTVFYRSTSDLPHQWKEYTAVINEKVLVSQLSENTIFCFKIVPHCEAGIGLESEISDPIKTKMITPSKPGKPKASSITHDSVQLQWTKPQEGAHNITSYTILYRSTDEDSNQWIVLKTEGSKERVTVTQLSEKTVYYFKVKPEYREGFGLESDVSEAIITRTVLPSKPGKPEASNITHNSIQLEWTKPNQGAHSITSYIVFYRSIGDPPNQWSEYKTEIAEERATVSSLSETTTYCFKIQSICVGGYGIESDISQPITTLTSDKSEYIT